MKQADHLLLLGQDVEENAKSVRSVICNSVVIEHISGTLCGIDSRLLVENVWIHVNEEVVCCLLSKMQFVKRREQPQQT